MALVFVCLGLKVIFYHKGDIVTGEVMERTRATCYGMRHRAQESSWKSVGFRHQTIDIKIYTMPVLHHHKLLLKYKNYMTRVLEMLGDFPEKIQANEPCSFIYLFIVQGLKSFSTTKVISRLGKWGKGPELLFE